MSIFLFSRFLFESKTIRSLLLFIVVVACSSGLDGGSRYAFQAQQMIGAEAWSQVIRINNEAPSIAYPASFYATVFEFDRALWLYTDMGTQRLSRGRNVSFLMRENLLPMLQRIESGIESYTVLATEGKLDEAPASFPKLLNGCLIESIWAFRQRNAEEPDIKSAEILCYSSVKREKQEEINARGEPDGHCVLVYRTERGHFFVDPSDLSVVGTFREDIAWNPATVAEEIELTYGSANIERAFFVPFGR